MLSKKTNDKEYLCQEENNDGPPVLRFMLGTTRESSGMLKTGTSAQEKTESSERMCGCGFVRTDVVSRGWRRETRRASKTAGAQISGFTSLPVKYQIMVAKVI